MPGCYGDVIARRRSAWGRRTTKRLTEPEISFSSCSTAFGTTRGWPRRCQELASARCRRTPVELRVVDGAVALQPADGLAPPPQPDPACTRRSTTSEDFVRYTRGSTCRTSSSSGCCRRCYLPTFLRATLGYRTEAMVSMPVLNRHTPINIGIRRVRAHADAQRHGGHARLAPVRRRPALVLSAQHRRDALPVRAARRGPERVAAHLGGTRRVQAHGRGGVRRATAPSSTRSSSPGCGTARCERRRTSTACSATLPTWCRRTRGSSSPSDHGELFGEERLLRPRPDRPRQGLRGPLRRGAPSLALISS